MHLPEIELALGEGELIKSPLTSQSGSNSHAAEPVLSDDDRPPHAGSSAKPAEKFPSLPNEIDGVNTDGRAQLDWKSKYDADALSEIYFDAKYIAFLLLLALVLIFLTWRGTAYAFLASGCASCSAATFNKYSYFFIGGLLGGVLFAVKYLYKVVARQYWNMDRRLWRLFSPLLSGGLALVVGALIDSGVLGLTVKVASGAAYFSYGFITGYFADRAIDKLQEVAETVFGAPGRKDAPKAK
jgi:hypothetical protein